MKKLGQIFLVSLLSLAIVFGFSACGDNGENNNSDLLDRLTALENKIAELTGDLADLETNNTTNQADIATLKTKVEILETASASYNNNIAALQTESETYAGDIEKLTKELTDLTAKVANATHIERTVIKPEDVGLDKPIVKYVGVEAALPNVTESVQNVKLGCSLAHRDYSFNYQLITFKTTLLVNNEPLQNFNVSVTQSKCTDSGLSQTFNTKIPYDTNSTDTYSATWSEIVLYRFV